MRFTLKRLFFCVAYAAVVCAISGARYRSFAWEDMSGYERPLVEKLAISLFSGLIVTTLHALLLWLVVRTWQHEMESRRE